MRKPPSQTRQNRIRKAIGRFYGSPAVYVRNGTHAATPEAIACSIMLYKEADCSGAGMCTCGFVFSEYEGQNSWIFTIAELCYRVGYEITRKQRRTDECRIRGARWLHKYLLKHGHDIGWHVCKKWHLNQKPSYVK